MTSLRSLSVFAILFVSLIAWVTFATAADTHLKVNAGGPVVGDWQSDARYARGGKHFPFHGEHDVSHVVAPAPNAVYQSVRHTDHEYDFSEVRDGNYVVRLHFTDGFRSTDRAMKYRIEGKTVIDDFSIYEAAGKENNRVIVRDIPVEVSDGDGLQIKCLKAGGNDVFEAAIEILSAGLFSKLDATKPVRIASKGKARSDTQKMVIPVAKPVDLPPAVGKVSDDVSRELLSLTGGRRIRLVWAQVDDAGDLMVTNGRSTLLYGLDTGDDRGERLIFEGKSGYSKPLLTPSGERIIYTNQKEGNCYVVNWDGTGHRKFAKGFASDTWRDPRTGIDWVYIRNKVGGVNGPIVRRQLDSPDVVETVWDRSPVGNGTVPWFRLSADGKYAADAFPWPKCGIADMTKKSFKLLGNGCWTSIAPDNSYRFFHFMGNHVELAMFDHGQTKPRMVQLNTMEKMAGKKVYHPRWSSDPRFLTTTGPERNSRSELYFGRFDENYARVEKWVRVTRNKLADYYGAAWIEPAPLQKKVALATSPITPEVAVAAKPGLKASANRSWPLLQNDLQYLWEHNNAENQIVDGQGNLVRICSGELTGKARFTRHFGLDLREGAFVPERASEALLAAAGKSNELTIEATLMTSSANQTGPARIISFSSGSSSRNFTLGQDSGQLVLRLRTPHTGENGSSPEVKLGKLKAGRRTHVLVRYRDGQLESFIDGKLSVTTDAVRGGFENWTEQSLIFGDEVGGDRNWAGELEGIAIYSRFLSDEEVALHHRKFTKRFDDRKPADRLIVNAELVEASRIPEVTAIGSYRRSIVRNLYRINRVVEGKAPSEKEIIVTEWAILDRKRLGSMGAVGDQAQLTLEPFDQHPELKSEWVQDDLSVFDAPVFHRVDR